MEWEGKYLLVCLLQTDKTNSFWMNVKKYLTSMVWNITSNMFFLQKKSFCQKKHLTRYTKGLFDSVCKKKCSPSVFKVLSSSDKIQTESRIQNYEFYSLLKKLSTSKRTHKSSNPKWIEWSCKMIENSIAIIKQNKNWNQSLLPKWDLTR